MKVDTSETIYNDIKVGVDFSNFRLEGVQFLVITLGEHMGQESTGKLSLSGSKRNKQTLALVSEEDAND